MVLQILNRMERLRASSHDLVPSLKRSEGRFAAYTIPFRLLQFRRITGPKPFYDKGA
jgi:hypothetical protein